MEGRAGLGGGGCGGGGEGGDLVGFSITGRKLVSSHAPAGCLREEPGRSRWAEVA